MGGIKKGKHRRGKQKNSAQASAATRGVDGGVTATGVLSRERGNLITISSTL